MSSYQFPPNESSTGLSFCLYEANGRLIYGTEEQFRKMEENALVC